MFVRRAVAAAFLGVSSYVLAIGLTLLFLIATYSTYEQFDPTHARHRIQITLAIIETAGVGIISVATIIGLPLLVARRLHANVLAAIFVAGLLVGVSAHPFLLRLSSLNDCNVHSSIPYRVQGCGE